MHTLFQLRLREMRYVMTLLFVGLLALGLPADGRAQVVELYDADTLPPLKGRNGYIVIGVDSGDTESFLVATKLVAHNRKARFIGGKLQTTNKKFRIELAGRETGFYFAVLPPGLYQITQINYPYFNLPFRLSTDGSREWRFFVEEDKVSYVGQLVVARERSEDSVDVNLLNRLAADYEQLTSTYSGLLEQYPLASGIGIRDDFLEFLATP